MATIKYLLTQDSESRWGLTINTVGIQDIAAGSAYPTSDHPEDYQFLPPALRHSDFIVMGYGLDIWEF